MFSKRASEKQINDVLVAAREFSGEVTPVTDVPVTEYMKKWLSVFAPDITYREAKTVCLPRRLYKNYLANAFYVPTTGYMTDEEASALPESPFSGKCYILFNEENVLLSVPDGKVFTKEILSGLDKVVVFDSEFTLTYAKLGEDEFTKKAEGMANA